MRRRTSPRWQGLDAAAARARCSTLVAIMRALNKLERPRRRRRWPEWDRNRTAISEFPVSEFPLSRFTMSMMRFHTKWSRFNQPGEIPVSSFHDQGPVPSQFQLSPPQRMFAEASTMLARLSFRRSQPEASKPLGFQPVPVARDKFQKRLARHSFPAPQEPISSWQCLAGPSCRKCRRISVPKIPGGCVGSFSRSFRQPLSGPS